MKKYLYILLFLVFCTVSTLKMFAAQATPLADFQTETVAAIREITLQLILISVGIFALLGSFATAEDRKFRCRWMVWIAFIAFVISIGVGLLTYGNLIWMLGKAQYSPFGTVRCLAAGQWVAFMVGGVLLAIFVLVNIRERN